MKHHMQESYYKNELNITVQYWSGHCLYKTDINLRFSLTGCK